MKSTETLNFISAKSPEQISKLWRDSFEGLGQLNHLNEYVPFPLTQFQQLAGFLQSNPRYRTWIIKREQDVAMVGFLVHGDFIPGHVNHIGFNIGLNYIRNGYGKEALGALLIYLKSEGLKETFGRCFESNSGSVKTMEACGFVNLGRTGKVWGNEHELLFKVELNK